MATFSAPLVAQEPAADRAGAVLEGGAAPELVTDRPDVTESTSIVPPGWMQLELGASLSREEESTETFSIPGTLVRLGLSSRVEARLGWEGYQDVDEPSEETTGGSSGAADGEVSVKLLLLEREGWRPDLALLPSLTLPLGEENFGSGDFNPGLKALFADDFSERVGWGANLGLEWPTEDSGGSESRRRLLSWSYSLAIGLTERVSGFLEIFGEDPGGEPARSSVDGGLTFRPGPHLQLDASGGVGLDEEATDWFVGGGLAFRLEL